MHTDNQNTSEDSPAGDDAEAETNHAEQAKGALELMLVAELGEDDV